MEERQVGGRRMHNPRQGARERGKGQVAGEIGKFVPPLNQRMSPLTGPWSGRDFNVYTAQVAIAESRRAVFLCNSRWCGVSASPVGLGKGNKDQLNPAPGFSLSSHAFSQLQFPAARTGQGRRRGWGRGTGQLHGPCSQPLFCLYSSACECLGR